MEVRLIKRDQFVGCCINPGITIMMIWNEVVTRGSLRNGHIYNIL